MGARCKAVTLMPPRGPRIEGGRPSSFKIGKPAPPPVPLGNQGARLPELQGPCQVFCDPFLSGDATPLNPLAPKRDEKAAFYTAMCGSGDGESALSQPLFHLISLAGLACLDLLGWLYVTHKHTYLCNTHTHTHIHVVHAFMRPSVISITVMKNLSRLASVCMGGVGQRVCV